MPREFSRTLRVGEQIRRELADLLRTEIKDPGMGMVTVGDVEVSKDLSHARVYFTVLGDAQVAAASGKALSRASGFLRRELGRRMRLRVVPALHFVFDDSELKGARVDALIEEAMRSDRARGQED
ncbi:ribosome-binding factor A [Acidihalobacter aeolianus]|uniref:Ribosome-binding factor A n=1 Tax=Acidihalobacter aeolianus TaxID=2792603 RepID=A0A1D8K8N3_9GAMM|nr:30S ribosome-binding factor RbfA [Acidihalobacter aeolianus]AOV17307.1 ribosome-binding factor A [Acidihalobacter aeolianus]